MKKRSAYILMVLVLGGGLTWYLLAPRARTTPPPSVTGEVTPAPPAAGGGAAPRVMDSAFKEGDLGVVLATALNVRSAPGRENSRVGLVRCGDVLALKAEDRGWYHIEVEGTRGWSYGGWITRAQPGGHLPECGKALETVTVLPAAPQRAELNEMAGKVVPEPAQHPVLSPQVLPVSSTPIVAADKKVVGATPEVPVSAHVSTKGQGPSLVTLSTGAKARSVQFPHHQHNTQFGCAQCHHPVDGSTQANDEKACRTCHVPPGGQGMSPVTNKDAFHRTCQNCHKVQSAGPTQCAACHTGA